MHLGQGRILLLWQSWERTEPSQDNGQAQIMCFIDIMFVRQDRPQSEGRRHAHPRIKLPLDRPGGGGQLRDAGSRIDDSCVVCLQLCTAVHTAVVVSSLGASTHCAKNESEYRTCLSYITCHRNNMFEHDSACVCLSLWPLPRQPRQAPRCRCATGEHSGRPSQRATLGCADGGWHERGRSLRPSVLRRRWRRLPRQGPVWRRVGGPRGRWGLRWRG